jgi:hypothetical protein
MMNMLWAGTPSPPGSIGIKDLAGKTARSLSLNDLEVKYFGLNDLDSNSRLSPPDLPESPSHVCMA